MLTSRILKRTSIAVCACISKPTSVLHFEMAISRAVEPNTYLEVCYQQQSERKPMIDFALLNVHKFFEQKHSTSQNEPMKVLDCGCGPVLAYSICAAGVNTEIVLAEYGEKSRNALQDWLDGSPSAWDWTPYIKYVVCELEHKDANEVQKRKQDMQKAIKAVVPCDIIQDPPIAKGYEGPYDVVMSILCLESACRTRIEYTAAVKRLATMVKTNGNLLLYTTVRNRDDHDDSPGYYTIGERRFIDVALPLKFVLSTLTDSGFTIVEVNEIPEEERAILCNIEGSDLESVAFITATKM